MNSFAKASSDELDSLLRLRKLEEFEKKQRRKISLPSAIQHVTSSNNGSTSETKPAFEFPSPLHLLLVLCPELTPHKWQAELQLQLGGFLDPKSPVRTDITPESPFILCLPAANGSGKDQFIIAAFTVWFALIGNRNRVITTSSSYEQLKYQTENHVKFLISRCNEKFGKIWESIEFFHRCTQTESEVKLFATDEAGKAEGYHPFPGGKMALIINEAKSVEQSIFDSLARCTGYSYWLEVSSPAGKSGHFYESAKSAVMYPDLPVLGKTYLRHVSAYDCPHIPRSHIEYQKERMTEWWFKSSILAQFTDFGESVVITEELWQDLLKNLPAPTGEDIGIGLDLAAGGNENACYVRKGNRVIDSFFFTQANTDLTANIIDVRLAQYARKYAFFIADDGGVGRGIIDSLSTRGWRISRRNNQSPARNKREYLNLGAENWFHIRKLIERKQIIPPLDDRTFFHQLTTRYYDQQSHQGKFCLESKANAHLRNKWSPDRADAFVLCFSTFKPGRDITPNQPAAEPRQVESIAELSRRYQIERRAPQTHWQYGGHRSIANVRL